MLNNLLPFSSFSKFYSIKFLSFKGRFSEDGRILVLVGLTNEAGKSTYQIGTSFKLVFTYKAFPT